MKTNLLLAAGVFAFLTASSQAQNLYISSSAAVGKYDAGTGSVIPAFTSPSGLFVPSVMALSGNTLYVQDFFGATGAYDATTGATMAGFTPITGVNIPSGLALSNNTLYVVDEGSGNGGDYGSVGTYNATTGALINANFISSGFDEASPISLLISGNTLYVGTAGNKVVKYSATTGALIDATFINSGLNYPRSLALSGTTLYVASSFGSTVGGYDATTGTAIAGFTTITGLNDPRGVAVSGNELYVSGYNGSTVGKYDATTGATIDAAFISGLTSPWALTVAPVPEPGSAALLGLGTLLLTARRRRSA